MTLLDNTPVLPERFEDLEHAERLRVLKAASAMTHFVFARAAAVLLSVPVGQTGYIRSASVDTQHRQLIDTSIPAIN